MSELLWVKRHSDLTCQDTSLFLSELERLSSLVNKFDQNSMGGGGAYLVFPLRKTESGL